MMQARWLLIAISLVRIAPIPLVALGAPLVPAAVLAGQTITDPVQVIAEAGITPSQVQGVSEMARQGIDRLAPMFPGTPNHRIRIFMHAGSASIAPDLLSSLHPGVPGFALLQRHQIHLVMDQIRVDPPNDVRTTVYHELVHILLDQMVGRNGLLLPRWFHEGLAQELAGGAYLGVQEEDLVYRIHTRTYIPFHSLADDFPKSSKERLALAYGQSYSFVAFLRREVGLDTLLAAARDCGPELSFGAAFARRTRQGLTVYEDRWIQYILHESGAGYRVILRNCFFILMIVAVGPLLALAVARRRNREEALKRKMAREEAAVGEDEISPPGASGSDADDSRGDGVWTGDDPEDVIPEDGAWEDEVWEDEVWDDEMWGDEVWEEETWNDETPKTEPPNGDGKDRPEDGGGGSSR